MSTREEEANPLHPWQPKYHGKAPEGVQKLLQGLLVYIISFGHAPERFCLPPLREIAAFWRVTKGTVSKWMATAERGGFLVRHAPLPEYPNRLVVGLVGEVETETA